MKETYLEAPRELEIYDKCDVLVVGSRLQKHRFDGKIRILRWRRNRRLCYHGSESQLVS